MRGVVFLFLFLVVPFVFGSGDVVLDKFFYSGGETATMIGSCTLPTEENVVGFVIWVNNSGGVLRNVSVNTGSCRSNFFYDQYVFGFSDNFNGTVNFTTSDAAWLDASDVSVDAFNVTAPQSLGCIITDVTSNGNVSVGEVGSVNFVVRDAYTNHSLINARCVGEGWKNSVTPLVFEPSNEFNLYRVTSADGSVMFSHDLDEAFWSVDTSYLFKFRCVCLANGTSGECYDSFTGDAVGLRSCSVGTPFITTGVDNRADEEVQGGGVLGVIIVLPMLAAFLLVFGVFGLGEEHYVLKIFLFLLSLLMFLLSLHLSMIAIVNYFNLYAYEDVIGSTVYWFSLAILCILVYFMIYIFYKGVQLAGQEKEAKMKY